MRLLVIANVRELPQPVGEYPCGSNKCSTALHNLGRPLFLFFIAVDPKSLCGDHLPHLPALSRYIYMIDYTDYLQTAEVRADTTAVVRRGAPMHVVLYDSICLPLVLLAVVSPSPHTTTLFPISAHLVVSARRGLAEGCGKNTDSKRLHFDGSTTSHIVKSPHIQHRTKVSGSSHRGAETPIYSCGWMICT